MISTRGTISAIVLNKIILRCPMTCLIECLDQVGICCFCLISVARNVPSTQVNRVSTFQIHQRVTEKRKGFSQTTNTDGDRDRTADRGRGIKKKKTIVRTAFRVRGSDKIDRTASRVHGVSHFTECADKTEDTSRGWNKPGSRTAQSARRRPAQHNT